MTAVYRVVGELGVFTANTPAGPVRTTVYKGSVVPDGATPEEIRHHLSMRLIEEVDGGPAPEPAPVGDGPPVAPPPSADSVPFDDPERVKAREKLNPDGSAPHANAAEAVWVEYAVSRGHSFDDAKAAGKEEIRKMFA